MTDTAAPLQLDKLDVAKLTGRVTRASKIDIPENAPRTPAGAYGGTAHVAIGKRPVGDAKEDVLVIVDGSTRTAFALSAVMTAILHDVIPRETIRGLWADADKHRADAAE